MHRIPSHGMNYEHGRETGRSGGPEYTQWGWDRGPQCPFSHYLYQNKNSVSQYHLKNFFENLSKKEVEDQSTLSEVGIEDHNVPSDTICTRARIQFHSIILRRNFFEKILFINFRNKKNYFFSVLFCLIIKFWSSLKVSWYSEGVNFNWWIWFVNLKTTVTNTHAYIHHTHTPRIHTHNVDTQTPCAYAHAHTEASKDSA